MRAEAQRHHAPSRRAPQLLLDEPFGCGEAAVGVRRRHRAMDVDVREPVLVVIRKTTVLKMSHPVSRVRGPLQ